ncbi:MAG: ArnT family glycosyltransferase [Pirellulaceae bacterium]
MSTRAQTYLRLCLLALVVCGINLGGAKLWDRDEPRNAGCAAEMLARGDWVVPVFDTELRTHKPVLLYWLIMSAYSVLGVNEMAARLPSVLLATGTVLCTYEMGRRLFSRQVGIWAATALATSLLFVMAGRAATPDAALIFFSTLSLTVYVCAVFPVEGAARSESKATGTQLLAAAASAARTWFPQSWPAVMAMYASMGLAVLAKGPVGCVLPCAVMGLFLWAMRAPGAMPGDNSSGWPRIRQFLTPRLQVAYLFATVRTMRPLLAATLVLVVAAPWYVWVGWRTNGQFLNEFFLEHNLSRAMQTMEGHRGNVLFYPLAILVGTFPWSIFAVPLVLDLRRQAQQRGGWGPGPWLALCWIGTYVAVFSCAQTKLPSYVTPCYPAVALLCGSFVDRWLTGQLQVPRGWYYAAFGVLLFVGGTISVAVPVAARDILPDEAWLGVLGAIPLSAGLACMILLGRGADRWAMATFATGAVALLVGLFGLGTSRVSKHQQYDELWHVVRAMGGDAAEVAAVACLEPSWVFYGRRPVEELLREGESRTATRWVQIKGRWQPRVPRTLQDFLASTSTPFVVALERDAELVERQLPPGFSELTSVPYFLKKERLILYGRSDVQPLALRGPDERR